MKADQASSKVQNAETVAKKKASEVASGAKKTAKQVHDEGQALGEQLGQSGRQAYENAQQLIGSVHDVRAQLDEALSHQAKTRPYIAMGAAAGIGFVLAGGLTVRLTSKLAGIGSRLLLSAALKRIVS